MEKHLQHQPDKSNESDEAIPNDLKHEHRMPLAENRPFLLVQSYLTNNDGNQFDTIMPGYYVINYIFEYHDINCNEIKIQLCHYENIVSEWNYTLKGGGKDVFTIKGEFPPGKYSVFMIADGHRVDSKNFWVYNSPDYYNNRTTRDN